MIRAGGWGGLVLLAAALLQACAPGEGPNAVPSASATTTIALGSSGATVWLASPDDDLVVELDADTLEPLRSVPVEGEPTHLAIAGDRVVVTLAQAAEVALLDAVTGAVSRVSVPCGGTHAAVARETTAWIACPQDDLVVELDLRSGAVARTIGAPGRPTALALLAGELVVTASRTGRLRRLALPDGRVTHEDSLSPGGGIAATQVDAVASAGDSVVVAYQRVDHDSDRARPAERGGYGSVLDGDPRIAPALHGPCGDRYARFDGTARVMSGPSAVALSGGVLWVANRYTDNVAALRCRGAGVRGGEAEVLAVFRVGRGPRGLAVSADGRTAFVDVGFDHAVARLSLDDGQLGLARSAEAELRRPVGDLRYSAAALRGRALFHDAVDTHLTPSGVVTCATCHPGGGEDGLLWFLHTEQVGPKVRRTPPAWAGRPPMAPFHWDGQYDDAGELARDTIVALMEGDGLLVDTGAMAAYMAEQAPPPGRPLPSGEALAAERGRALFESAEVGCASCHAGEALTDSDRHSVVSPSLDPDATLESVHTPTLRGVRARPPFLHDGRAGTLLSVLEEHNPGDRHGRTSHLTAEDLADLVLYMETL